MSVTPVSRATLLKTQLDRFSRAIAGIEKGDVKSLHRARVASRRLRELVPALQLDADTGRKLNRRLRKVTNRLGTVRELDVLLLLIDELHVSRPNHQGALRRVRSGVIRDRNAARKHLLRHLPVRSMQRVSHKLERILVELAHEKPRAARRAPAASRAFVWALDARVANRAARLQGAMTEAGAVYLPERLHAVRIALKKLRYAMELPSRSRGGSEPPALRTLKRVQRLLGRMHDLQVLIDRVRDVQASLTPPSLAVWRELDELVLALDDMCRRLHARYVREREALEAAMGAVTPPASTAPRERRVG